MELRSFSVESSLLPLLYEQELLATDLRFLDIILEGEGQVKLQRSATILAKNIPDGVLVHEAVCIYMCLRRGKYLTKFSALMGARGRGGITLQFTQCGRCTFCPL